LSYSDSQIFSPTFFHAKSRSENLPFFVKMCFLLLNNFIKGGSMSMVFTTTGYKAA
jgi:hypothetical protein